MEILRDQFRDISEQGEVVKGDVKDISDTLLKDNSIIDELKEGELSPLMTLKNGVKGKLQRVGNKINIYESKDKLTIPNELLGMKLDEDKKKSLSRGETVLLNKNGKSFYFSVDKETNSIIVKGDKDFKMPKTIGDNKVFNYDGYELNDIDKALLANGKSIDKKLLCGEKGFFMADIKLTEENKGIQFSNITPISEKKAQELQKTTPGKDLESEKQLAQDKGLQTEEKSAENKVVEQVAMGTPVVHKEEFKETNKTVEDDKVLNSETKVGKEDTQSLDSAFIGALKDDDWLKVNELSKDGYVPSESVLKKIEGVSEEKKIAVDKIFNLKKEKTRKAKIAVEKDPDQKDKSHKKNKVVNSARQAVTTLFNGI